MKAEQTTKRSSRKSTKSKVEPKIPEFKLGPEFRSPVDFSDREVQTKVLECAMPLDTFNLGRDELVVDKLAISCLLFLERLGTTYVKEYDSDSESDSDVLTCLLDFDSESEEGYKLFHIWETVDDYDCRGCGLHSVVLIDEYETVRDFLVNNLKAQKEAFLKRISDHWDGIEERAITALVEHLLKTRKVVISE